MSNDEITVRCAECGGAEVQVAKWVEANTGEVHDDFHSWDCLASMGASWCADCGEHTRLVDKNMEPEDFAIAEAKANARTRPPSPAFRTAWMAGYRSWVAFGSRPKGTGPKALGFDAAAADNERGGMRPTAGDACDEYENRTSRGDTT